jgi:hypothetical protein
MATKVSHRFPLFLLLLNSANIVIASESADEASDAASSFASDSQFSELAAPSVGSIESRDWELVTATSDRSQWEDIDAHGQF